MRGVKYKSIYSTLWHKLNIQNPFKLNLFFTSNLNNSIIAYLISKMVKDKITIAIIEDNREVAEELKDSFNIQENMVCNQIYYSAEDALIFLPKFPVDVVIVDIGLPVINGIEAIEQLKSAMSSTEFCMFTVFENDDKIFKSIKAGARGYILKNSTTRKVIESIEELYNGGSPMSPNIARKVIEAFAISQQMDTKSILSLTKRENEILVELSKGLLYKEVALKLGITIGTVKQYIHTIYEKLEVNNRTEALNKYYNRK